MKKDKILIVEDEELIREIYEMVSINLNLKPISYTNGNDFINDYENHIKEAVVGIFDNDFPGKYKGTDLIKEVTDKYNLHSILISGTSTPEELSKKAFENGASAFYEKPFDLHEITKEIKKGLEKKL